MSLPTHTYSGTRCRWCHHLMSQVAGLCPANTSGCGPWCGFFCGCNPDTWAVGPHQPDTPTPQPELDFVATTNQWGPTYVVGDGTRAIEWLLNGDRPWEITHTPAEGPGVDVLPCGRVHAGHCVAQSRPLGDGEAALFRVGDIDLLQRVMCTRWALGDALAAARQTAGGAR